MVIVAINILKNNKTIYNKNYNLNNIEFKIITKFHQGNINDYIKILMYVTKDEKLKKIIKQLSQEYIIINNETIGIKKENQTTYKIKLPYYPIKKNNIKP